VISPPPDSLRSRFRLTLEADSITARSARRLASRPHRRAAPFCSWR